MRSYLAAVIQAGSLPDDSRASAEKAAEKIHEAAAAGARLAVFPEAFLGGYPKGDTFGCPVGMRRQEGRAAFARYFANAIALDGVEVEIVAEAAAQTGMFVVMGCIEREGGTLYCTALFLDGARGVVGKHRKLMPTAGERLIWGFGDGSTMPAFKTPLGTIGAVICWKNICRCCACTCLRKASRSIARRRQTTAKAGCPRCATSRLKVAATF